MTNAEKFKEVFGFEFELAPYEADCWCPFQRTKCRDTEFDCFEDCVKPFWQSKYQGEPTIPLSVIEKIHDAIDNAKSDGFLINENGHMLAMTLTKEHIHEIINEAVKEYTHEDT